MDSRARASPEQFSTLLEYMESHGDLARPLTGAQGRIRSDQLWADLTNILNAVGGGVNKTTEKWKKVWADWKSKTKKKALVIRNHARGTGGGPASRQTLSYIDERVLAIMGALAVEGQNSVEELGFNRSQSSTRSHLSPPITQDAQDEQVYLEIVDETPHLTSDGDPQPSTSQTSNSHHRPSVQIPQTPLPHPQIRAVPSSQGRLPATPSPTPPPARTAPTTPPTRRRLRLRSPATPQSVASVDRPRLRARRRRAPTPFERAASEFTAVELRRLELEESRTRLLHERDMRALEVEHDRNQVFKALVNVAQDWLNYYRSKDNTEPLNTE